MDHPRHRLLIRQLRNSKTHFEGLTPNVQQLLAQVDRAYFDFDEDRRLLEHATNVSSNELMEINRQLKQASLEAQQAAENKAQFLASMSHEIRTPMNGVLGMLGILSEQITDQVSLDTVELAKRSAKSLLTIINDILDLSKMEAGKFTIDAQPVSVRQITDELIAVFSAAFRERSLQFVAHTTERVPQIVVSDGGRLRQIINNLLGNAAKFSPAGGAVVMWVDFQRSDTENRLYVAVADTGPGIKSDKLDLIFESFSQADSSISRNYGGTGLGLTICKQLVELMGGHIWVTSMPEVGSTFRFFVNCQVLEDNIASSQEACVQTQSAGAFPPGALENLSILVAEDNLINQKIITHALKKYGCKLTMAQNGLEATQKFLENEFDLVLMDCQMPIMSGFEAAKMIRNSKKGKSIPIIALTALAMENDRERCRAAGMNDYLSKPYEIGAVVDKIMRYCPKRSR